MPEREPSRDSVRAGSPISVGSVTLLPIERIVLSADRREAFAWYTAAKEPYALIVRDAGGIRAFGRDAVAVPLEALREKFPGLDSVLAAM